MGISFVQSKNPNGGYGTSATLTFSSNVTSGDLILVPVIAAWASDASLSDVSISDNHSNTYSLVTDGGPYSLFGTTSYVWLFYAIAGTTASTTVTCTLSSTPDYGFEFSILEYSGTASSPKDGTQYGITSGSSTENITGASLTPSGTNELYFHAAWVAAASGFTPASGFTTRVNQTGGVSYWYCDVEDNLVSSTTQPTATINAPESFIAVSALFLAGADDVSGTGTANGSSTASGVGTFGCTGTANGTSTASAVGTSNYGSVTLTTPGNTYLNSILPSGFSLVTLQCWGGGGAGGCSDGTIGAGGGGGGGFAQSTFVYNSNTQNLYVIVGYGGSSTTGGGSGQGGGNSSLSDNSIIAVAGGGGSGSSFGGTGGAGGTDNVGTITHNGGIGAGYVTTSGGGGGSSAGTSSAGNNGSGTTGGSAVTGGGSGGAGSTSASVHNGGSPGGGGGGGSVASDAIGGGDGESGQIIVTWSPAPSFSIIGTSSASGVWPDNVTGVGTASGTSSCSGTGVTAIQGTFLCSGTSSCSGTGVTAIAGVGTANGTSSTNFVGVGGGVSIGTALGTSTLNFLSAGPGVGTANGTSSCAGVGASITKGVGSSPGEAFGAAFGIGAVSGPSDVIRTISWVNGRAVAVYKLALDRHAIPFVAGTTLTGSGSVTLDLNVANNFQITLTGNTTLTVANGYNGATFQVQTIQDSSGGHSLTWFSPIVKPSGQSFTISSGANEIDWYSFVISPSAYLGNVVGQNLS